MAEQHRLRWVLLGVVLTFALLGSFFVLALVTALAFRAGSAPAGKWSEETVVKGEDRKIAMVMVQGEIQSAFDPFSSGGASDAAVISQIEQALEDDDVAGIIVHLDTPGGGVVASDAISRKVREADKRKPVLALMDETAASGGYYIAASAREIIANPSTITGSIGVIMIVPNVTKAADKVGIHPIVIKSGPFKDIASPFKDMSPEERAILQGVIDESYNQFVDTVATGRKMDPARVRQIADGRVYTGRQAKELGLVDELGDQELALTRARAAARAPKAALVRYEPRGILHALLGASSKALDGGKVLKDTLGIDPSPGLKYLWQP